MRPQEPQQQRYSTQDQSQLSGHPPSLEQAKKLLHDALSLIHSNQCSIAIPLLERSLHTHPNSSYMNLTMMDTGMCALARCYAETSQLGLAKHWTDRLYATGRIAMAEPAYHLCRALREDGQNEAAFYYYLLATRASTLSSSSEGCLPAEPEIEEYLLDYEKTILWSYINDMDDFYSRLHGLSFCMRVLDKRHLPNYIRDSVFSNLQYYVPHLGGQMEILRAEASTEEEWRYSSPTFVGGETLIRVVNYYVSDDGSYHVSKGHKVMTRLISSATDEIFEMKVSDALLGTTTHEALHHLDAYILGLEDTRAVVDSSRNNTIFTLSASQEYSLNAKVMSQVLGTLSLADHTLTIQAVLQGPYPDRHDKNWVFAGGLNHVVYGWYPSIEIGSINLEQQDARLHIHSAIPSPPSFHGMRGSTNGVLYKNEWWFVTHAVIYRQGQMRKYLHRLVVLNQNLSAIVRHSLPFTFEKGSDVEYCLGLKVEYAGLVFGYSVRDRSTRILNVQWSHAGCLFGGDIQ